MGPLTLSGSSLYGMTSKGGSNNVGTIFRMNTDGSGFTVLNSFTSSIPTFGPAPECALTVSGTKLYGVTPHGGDTATGTLFSLNTDGTGFSLLHTFTASAEGCPDGCQPFGSLTLSGSKLFGMTRDGGNGGFGSGDGTLYSINTDGTGFNVILRFDNSNGIYPRGSLTLSGSTLYGMTAQGGGTDPENPGSEVGTIFSIGTDGTGFSVLHLFTAQTSDGANPYGSLTLSGSALYGLTYVGGSSNLGTLFRIGTDGTGFSLLHSFTGGGSDGAYPFGSLTLSGSTLFGMSRYGGSGNSRGFGFGEGTLFSIGTDGTGFSLLESFGVAISDPAYPLASEPTLSADGTTLYGVTQLGGAVDQGVVFSRSLVVPEPGTFALLGLGALFLAVRRRNARG